MQVKIFSAELFEQHSVEKELTDVEKDVNAFLNKHKGCSTVRWLQSSTRGSTRLTALVSYSLDQ